MDAVSLAVEPYDVTRKEKVTARAYPARMPRKKGCYRR